MTHPEEHVQRFSGRADAYDRFRERYDPAIVLPRLREWCGLTSEWTVADVGAGTGMLADVFLANGNRVIAIEPNEDMREACRALHHDEPSIDVREGTAEATKLANGSVEMVSAGRALHWFDLELSMQEFRRILKPRGWVAVVAFGRADDGRGENQAFEQLLRDFSGSGRSTHASYVNYERLRSFFAEGEFRHEEIRGEMKLDWEHLRGLTRSLSHAPRECDSSFTEFETKLRDLFREFERNGELKLDTRHWISAGRFE